MIINKHTEGNTLIITVEGWLDIESTPVFADYVKDIEPADSLVLDFEKLEYVSSSGLREIVALYKAQKNAGKEFKVINVNEEVMDVFTMTGIHKKIDISAKQ